jgi:hypothetical protein
MYIHIIHNLEADRISYALWKGPIVDYSSNVAGKCNEFMHGTVSDEDEIWHGFALFRETQVINGIFLVADVSAIR